MPVDGHAKKDDATVVPERRDEPVVEAPDRAPRVEVGGEAATDDDGGEAATSAGAEIHMLDLVDKLMDSLTERLDWMCVPGEILKFGKSPKQTRRSNQREEKDEDDDSRPAHAHRRVAPRRARSMPGRANWLSCDRRQKNSKRRSRFSRFSRWISFGRVG